MIFQKHSNLEGQHAFLGASNYHWINYDEQRVAEAYYSHLVKEKGTKLHEFAAMCIKLGQKLPRSNKTLNRYVNDAIGYGMSPEVLLYYSDICFGTADTIGFHNRLLRVHDLKTGNIPAKMEQLKIYTALFCLEYRMKPSEFDTELRIYQMDDVIVHTPSPDEINPIIDKIIRFDKIITKIKHEEG